MKCYKHHMAYINVGGGSSSSKSRSKVVSPGLLKYAEPTFGNIQSGATSIKDVKLPSTSSDDALFKLMTQRFLESTRPGMAARGLLTSGGAQEVENRGISDLALQFGDKEFDRALSRSSFEREGYAQYTSALLDALQRIVNQGTTGQSSSKSMNFNLGLG